MDREEIKTLIKEILQEVDPLIEVGDTEYLMDESLDSAGLLYLFTELTERLDIEIPMIELTQDNFSTVENIAKLAERYVR